MKRLLMLVLLLSLLPSLVFPKSIARVRDCTIEVTIQAAFTGKGATDAFAERFEQAVEKAWNKGYLVGECGCEFKVDVVVKTVSDCSEAYDSDFFCFNVSDTKGVTRSNAFRSDFTKQLSDDHAETASGPGRLEAHDTDNILAHEAGHLMGLHDEYEDMYAYYVVDSDRKRVSGPHYISPQDWYDKGNGIKTALPQGQNLEFAGGGYNSLLHPVRKSGVENDSLMAYVGPGAEVKQRHVDAIFAQTSLKCPDICCCGNGKIDAGKGEECDPKASPNGCETYYSCQKDCKCKADFLCGDGKVSGPEECDPEASPTGCKADEECASDCRCKKKPEPIDEVPDTPAQSPPYPAFDFEILSPAEGMAVSFPMPVIVDYRPPHEVLLIEYYLADDLVYSSHDPFFQWILEPWMFGSGHHVLTIRVKDLGSNEQNKSVGFEILEEV